MLWRYQQRQARKALVAKVSGWQDYLPTKPGTAAGVTLGLAVSAGGLFVPALGVLADRHGPQAVLTALCVVPVLAVALAVFLPEPSAA